MKEYKGFGGGKVSVDGEKLFIKLLFIKENCSFADVQSVRWAEPTAFKNGELIISTQKYNNPPHTIYFLDRDRDSFFELYNEIAGKTSSRNTSNNGLVAVQSPVLLKAGETAYLSYPAVRYITTHRVIGKAAGTVGVGVRAGRFSVHGGGVQGQSIWGDVVGTFQGHFTLTNMRMVFIAEQKGYECKLSSVSAISQGDDGLTIIATPKETYNMHLIQNISPAKMKKLQAGKKEKLPVIADACNILVDMIEKINS